MRKNIIPVTLSGCTTRKIVTAELWQYDSLQDPKHRRTMYEIQIQVRQRPEPEGAHNV